MTKIGILILARDEEKSIRDVIEHAISQTHKAEQIVVVNDNSKDNTARIIDEYYPSVTRADFPIDHSSWTTSPDLARVVNFGFEQMRKDLDYYMIIGGDHIISHTYIKSMLMMMEKDDIHVSSGIIDGEVHAVRGSGRIISREVMCMQNFSYPIGYGYETYMLYRAKFDGFNVKPLSIRSGHVTRPTGTNYTSVELNNRGRAYKCLGHSFPFVMAVAVKTYHSPRDVLAFANGYIRCNDASFYEKELRDHVRGTERALVSGYIKHKNLISNRFKK